MGHYEQQLQSNLKDLEGRFQQRGQGNSVTDKRLALAMGVKLPSAEEKNANYGVD